MGNLIATVGEVSGDPEYRKYQVSLYRCNVKENDIVTPDTVIGHNFATGQSILAEVNGRVASMFFNPMHNLLMVMVVVVPTY